MPGATKPSIKARIASWFSEMPGLSNTLSRTSCQLATGAFRSSIQVFATHSVHQPFGLI